MPDKLSLVGCQFLCHIGCTEAERDVLQPIEIDVEVLFDARPSAQSDQLIDTIDSMKMQALIKVCVEQSRFRLIETLVDKIAGCILAAFTVSQVRVCLRKPQPMAPHGGGHVLIEIVRPSVCRYEQ